MNLLNFPPIKSKFIRVGDTDYIDIEANGLFTYHIILDQLKSDCESSRMNWLEHLRRKVWFTPKVEHDFAELLQKHAPGCLATMLKDLRRWNT